MSGLLRPSGHIAQSANPRGQRYRSLQSACLHLQGACLHLPDLARYLRPADSQSQKQRWPFFVEKGP